MVKKYGELYLRARRALLPVEGEQAAYAARELLALASGKSAAAVLADRELYASEAIEERLQGYVDRMLQNEPLAYILGSWSFYGLDFSVGPGVLIPRDDTMAVTDLALEYLRGRPAPQRALDLCTGSGCIGAVLAHQLPSAHITEADVSRDALAAAKQNIHALHLQARVALLALDVRRPSPGYLGSFDVIVSNPPYVTAEQMAQLPPSVRDYEPALALDGGGDGLQFYRDIVQNYAPRLLPDGAFCFEFGMGQHTAVGQILRDAGFSRLTFRNDLRGVIRAVRAEKE